MMVPGSQSPKPGLEHRRRDLDRLPHRHRPHRRLEQVSNGNMTKAALWHNASLSFQGAGGPDGEGRFFRDHEESGRALRAPVP